MPDPKTITDKQARTLIEQNAEIIKRLGVLILLLTPRRPGSDVILNTAMLGDIVQQAEAMAMAIQSEYVR